MWGGGMGQSPAAQPSAGEQGWWLQHDGVGGVTTWTPGCPQPPLLSPGRLCPPALPHGQSHLRPERATSSPGSRPLRGVRLLRARPRAPRPGRGIGGVPTATRAPHGAAGLAPGPGVLPLEGVAEGWGWRGPPRPAPMYLHVLLAPTPPSPLRCTCRVLLLWSPTPLKTCPKPQLLCSGGTQGQGWRGGGPQCPRKEKQALGRVKLFMEVTNTQNHPHTAAR